MSDSPPPAYAGLLRASKQISAEVQEQLYKTCVFRAYLCKYSACEVPLSYPPVFSRLQNVEFFLDLSSRPSTRIGVRADPEKYYREWFGAFTGSAFDRKYCRVTFSNIKFGNIFIRDGFIRDNIYHTVVFQQFMRACKRFVGFQIVILELGKAIPLYQTPFPQRPCPQAATGPAQDPLYAGEELEALKRHLEAELQPTLGPCVYYDRGTFRCLEFRPRDTVNPIEAGQAPFVDPMED